jgi:hypothetical protein
MVVCAVGLAVEVQPVFIVDVAAVGVVGVLDEFFTLMIGLYFSLATAASFLSAT